MSEENFNTEENKNPDVTVERTVISSDVPMGASPIPPQKQGESEPREPRRVSLVGAVCTCVAFVLAAVMLTFTLCQSAYEARLRDVQINGGTVSGAEDESQLSYELRVLEQIFKTYSFEELDEKTMRTEILKAYVRATGDEYAEYYTNEEYAALVADMGGETQGIGINIINSSVEIGGVEYKALEVINVVKDSPAMKAELNFGDFIIAVGTLEEHTTINELGYDMALKQLQGVKGTEAQFLVYRKSTAQTLPFSIVREKFQSDSVMYRKADADVKEGTGIVKILEFDRTTPTQVKAAIEALKNEGCDKFVFDVRYNPGGELSSIVAVLSLFLEEGDTVISVKDKAGNTEVTRVAPVESVTGCSVKAEDIGIYKDLNMVVLCNGSTASAAELFVANFRDHGLGDIIGTRTYGKGSMQSYLSLAYFGCDGVLKITRHMYFPPNGESYDGKDKGIQPTHAVDVSEEASKLSIYKIMGTKDDNQLVEAVKYFK